MNLFKTTGNLLRRVCIPAKFGMRHASHIQSRSIVMFVQFPCYCKGKLCHGSLGRLVTRNLFRFFKKPFCFHLCATRFWHSFCGFTQSHHSEDVHKPLRKSVISGLRSGINWIVVLLGCQTVLICSYVTEFFHPNLISVTWMGIERFKTNYRPPA
jgi:hypothetical protein